MSDEEEKEPEFRVKIVGELTAKLEKVLFDGMTEHKMSIWETEGVFLRLRFDLDEYKHMILHKSADDSIPEFKGTKSIYR